MKQRGINNVRRVPATKEVNEATVGRWVEQAPIIGLSSQMSLRGFADGSQQWSGACAASGACSRKNKNERLF
jgi:hypothetical protein